jgi:hypothetical protein
MYYLYINFNINYNICQNVEKFKKLVFSKNKSFVKENRELVWNNIQEYCILFFDMES